MALTKVTGAGIEGVTISSTTDTSDQFILTNTDTGSSSGPDLVLHRKSTSSAADSDGLGRIDFRGLNDANEDINYATIYSKISDASDGTEDGEFYIQQISNGSYVTTLKIDGIGAVTKPLQPAFLVHSGGQSNIATDSQVVLTMGTEVFDNNADYSSNTFTAPVTGRYQFNWHVRFDALDSAATYYRVYLATSNRTFWTVYRVDDVLNSDAEYWSFNGAHFTDMEANDTAQLGVYQAGGTQQTDIDNETHFSGFLVC